MHEAALQEQERQRQRRERSKLGLGLRRTLSRQSSQLSVVRRAKERRRANKVRSPPTKLPQAAGGLALVLFLVSSWFAPLCDVGPQALLLGLGAKHCV